MDLTTIHAKMCQNRPRSWGLGWCRVAISFLRMLTTSARFWFWPYNFGIGISRKNCIKSIQFDVDNRNISQCKQQTHTIIQQRIWICCHLMTVPWLRNGLWILMRNWVIFLQDMCISHSLLHVQWSNWQFSQPIRYDVSRCGMFYSLKKSCIWIWP